MHSELEHILAHRRSTLRSTVSQEEWAARQDLAACYRLAVHYRMTDRIFNHISLRVPGTEHQFLINPFGLLYEEVCASNLVKIDVDGRAVDDGLLDVNPTGFVIHAAIHKARPEVGCVFHTHTRAGVAVSARDEGLLPISQQAMRFHERIGYHDYEGLALDLDEQVRLARDLGPHNALILRHHGLLTVGVTVRDAFEEMFNLEAACQIQLDATSGGSTVRHVAPVVAEHAARQLTNPDSGLDGRDWRAMRRMLDRIDPSYLD